MLKNILGDLKTTIAGIALGAAVALKIYFAQHGVDTTGILAAVGPVILGALSKL